MKYYLHRETIKNNKKGAMKRKDVRKVLKQWVLRENTEYNCLKFTFLDIGIHKSEMNKVFESLVDEVYKMVGKEA
jgi:hypothetical protein